MTNRFMLAFAGALILAALPVLAQDNARDRGAGAPVPLRATVENFAGGTATVRTEFGVTARVDLTQKTKISGVVARKLSDIKPNEFIGVTAMRDKDGVLHATEVHIFPDKLRGVGEGHYGADKGPESSMTNAAVAGIVNSANGKVFTMDYKEKPSGQHGQVKIDIAPNTPIVAFVPGDESLLKPGAHVMMFVRKKDDGTYTALNIIAEKDGVKPPM
jgi:hypothetical protein